MLNGEHPVFCICLAVITVPPSFGRRVVCFRKKIDTSVTSKYYIFSRFLQVFIIPPFG